MFIDGQPKHTHTHTKKDKHKYENELNNQQTDKQTKR